MNALHTDLYELTMAAGFFESGKHREQATFELFVRRFPANRTFLIAAGLAQAVEYLLNLSFTGEQIDYLRSLPAFLHASPGFFDYLRELRFTGDLWAMPEGTVFFPGEPVLCLRAPLIEAQLPETFLLATVAFQSMIASKAALVVDAAGGRSIIEFGSRRAHSPEAAVLAGRAAYIAGCSGTSNVEAGFRFGVPVYGTAAHSWTMAFASEAAAFRHLQKLLGPETVYLIDTYDTIEGVRRAAALGQPLWGVRLDSGDLVDLSRAVRRILDEAGLKGAKIMASGDLNEDKIRDLLAAGAEIDSFGVGTELATSADAPNLSAVYKMVEIEVGGIKRFTVKFSSEKQTWPGPKQVFRFDGVDQIACSWECPSCPPGSPRSEALLRPVMLKGRLVEPLPALYAVRAHCERSKGSVQPGHRVGFSAELQALAARVRPV
ncbi:MAG TPA: nicotinate phosphoribosyltransferase [Bryobacteraceae bacterium]|nr:nicotinate phosphoribosyltransferase [Bryobacteraceae bacterium]